jgi:hypothetical protein
MDFKEVINKRRAVNFFDETKKLHPPKWRKTFEEIVVTCD